MGQGLLAIGTTSIIQVDGIAPTIGLVEKGTLGTSPLVIGGLANPIIATAGEVRIESVSTSGSTYTWNFVGTGEYFIFDLPSVAASVGMGLEVFHPVTGVLGYSAGLPPMRIINRYTQTYGSELSSRVFGPTNYAAAGTKLAIIQNRPIPILINHVFVETGLNTYDAYFDVYDLLVKTPKSSETLTGNVETTVSHRGTYLLGSFFGLKPSDYTSWNNDWDLWIVNVSNC